MEASKETLTKFPDSVLAKMVTTAENNILQLDMDPEYFRVILNWLR